MWHLLSSTLLYSTARSAGCTFCCTRFVEYECLDKPGPRQSRGHEELQRRLREELRQGRISSHSLSLEDLDDIAVLQSRKRLGKGELSSIAFARRIRRALMTDDQKARRLAEKVMDVQMVQTTPHLLGWLVFSSLLADHDKNSIIAEHEAFDGKLRSHFETMYLRALQYRAVPSRATAPAPSPSAKTV